MAMNREWHEAHPMPRNATLEQRAEWHLEHERNCSCRPIPRTVREYLESRSRSPGK
jgi:hypothetical protein